MENKIKLYQKIAKVMKESPSVDKTMTVGSGKNSYKGLSEAVVLGSIKPLLLKFGLAIFPIDGDIEDKFGIYKKYDIYKKEESPALRAMTQLKVYYKIVDIDTGESEILVGFGNGSDTQDKGAGKASTYSYKNVLQKTFMLFSGDDTSNEHSDDIEKSTQIGEPEKKPAPKGKASTAKAPASKSASPASKPAEKKKEEPPADEKPKFTESTPLPSGKYEGRALKDIVKFAPEWVELLQKKTGNAVVREVCSEVLKNNKE